MPDTNTGPTLHPTPAPGHAEASDADRHPQLAPLWESAVAATGRSSDGAHLDPAVIGNEPQLTVTNAVAIAELRDRVTTLEATCRRQQEELQELRRTVSNTQVIARVSYEDGIRDATPLAVPAPTAFVYALHAGDGKTRDVRVTVDGVEHVIGVEPDVDADPNEKWESVLRSIHPGGGQWAS